LAKSLLTLALLGVILPAPLGGSMNAQAGDADENSAATAAQPGNVVIQWNRILLQIVRTPGAQPATIHPTRSFAIMHAAIYDAVNTIDKTHTPYLVSDLAPLWSMASPEAAAASAAFRVLFKLYPNQRRMLVLQWVEQLRQIPEDLPRSLGVRLGFIVGDRILEQRSNDGSNTQLPAFVAGNAPGNYQLTPPNFPQPAFRQWPQVTPFTLAKADQFRLGPPPMLTSETYTAAFQEVKELGFMESTTRSADQTQIGRFWNGSIWDYWNEIAQTAAVAHNLTVPESARLFALLNLTLADSAIAFYDTKYTYLFWRPVTAIRAADTDGNSQTVGDPNWLPLSVKTAPDPSYPGAHSTISASAAAVLKFFFNTDDFSYAVTSEVLPGVERSFASFTAAAEEAGLSRIYAGVHFRTDHTSGRQLGLNVAAYVVQNFLVPVGESGNK
jgi:membrane-associated phospholipid phosphatase